MQACGLYPMVGTPDLDAGPAKKRNHMVLKTRKAESVALASGSILSPSEAVAFEFGPNRSCTVFVAYEEVTRGMRGRGLRKNQCSLPNGSCILLSGAAAHAAYQRPVCCVSERIQPYFGSSVPLGSLHWVLASPDAVVVVIQRMAKRGRCTSNTLQHDAGDSGNLSSPAATLVPAIPLLLVAARLTAEVVPLAPGDADSGSEDVICMEGAEEGHEEAMGIPQGPTAKIATVDGCALPAVVEVCLHSVSMLL